MVMVQILVRCGYQNNGKIESANDVDNWESDVLSKFIVRYGTMRSLGVMNTRSGDEYRRGMEVVVRTERGLEVGQVLCESTEDALSHLDQPANGTIVRAVSQEDAVDIDAIDGARISNIEICKRHVEKLGLAMKLVEVEQLLGRQRMIIYYLSEDRVDFRELVKVLASEFQARIEMKQIGVRDEAKLLADYGDCGKPVCCNNHLVKMPPVSMKMAKLQKASLDPTKISGRCGRLKCCLRYEFDTYQDIQRELPKVGAQIVTREGKARVIAQQIIAEQLLVETEDHRRMLIEASEVLSVIRNSSKGGQSANAKMADPERLKEVSARTRPASSSKKDKPSDDAATEQRGLQATTKESDAEIESGESSTPKKKRRRPRRRRKPKDPPSSS